MKKYSLPALALLLIALAFCSFRFQQSTQKSAIVFPEKMNVFYIGVDNPVSVSVPGVPASNLTVQATGAAKVSGQNGKYIVRVTGGTETNINVDYRDDKGKLVELPSWRFRIKRVPDPVCYVGNVKGIGMMSKAEFAAQNGVLSRMENFDFDLYFNVVSYVFATCQDTAYTKLKSNGPGFTAEMKSLMNKAKPKDRFYIEEVIVKGPDGTLRKIPGVTIEVK